MFPVKIDLINVEVNDIINVLGQLPTSSNAWPLVQKITAQLNAQTPTPEENVEDAKVVDPATPTT